MVLVTAITPQGPGTPHFIPPEDNSKNIIPVYCSILAAVVVGLIGYVAFKCWVTCKQKKLLAKQRVGELAASGEGEKLHSDSGVFLDTHSLQEPNQLNKDWDVLLGTMDEYTNVNEVVGRVTDYINFCTDMLGPTKKIRCFANNKPMDNKGIEAFAQQEKKGI
ncbi:unnamed protein product [Ranitomeya imitator]|uniref:Tumor necrosis factor receptor member 16 transmembrane domain-containing protein n=1 Tax=Ranitomeya imitator TaxID=111125 RepID=A0ABN9MB34_9NEOB|nr:unnamed protein product [Ranitomeya imitator]